MAVQASAISPAGARASCRTPWDDEQLARGVAALLAVAGWQVDHREQPVELDGGLWSVAVVREDAGSYVGDVTFRQVTDG
jgi:hypothetical protein